MSTVLSWETSLTHVQKFMTMLENLARKSKKAIGKATAERRCPCSSHNNWTEVRDSLYMASIYRLTGVNFWQSAKHLSEKIEVDDRGVPTKLTALPFYFLVSHATELLLKSALLKRALRRHRARDKVGIEFDAVAVTYAF